MVVCNPSEESLLKTTDQAAGTYLMQLADPDTTTSTITVPNP